MQKIIMVIKSRNYNEKYFFKLLGKTVSHRHRTTSKMPFHLLIRKYVFMYFFLKSIPFRWTPIPASPWRCETSPGNTPPAPLKWPCAPALPACAAPPESTRPCAPSRPTNWVFVAHVRKKANEQVDERRR